MFVSKSLTARQQQVLDFIRSEIKAGRGFPTVAHINQACGIAVAVDICMTLHDRGYLKPAEVRAKSGRGRQKFVWELVAT